MARVTSTVRTFVPTGEPVGCGSLSCSLCYPDRELEAALLPVATGTARDGKVAPSARPVSLPVVLVDVPELVARQDRVFGGAPQDY